MRVLPPTLAVAAALASVPTGAAADGMAPYPDLAHASRAHVGEARRLWHGTLSAALHHFPGWTAAWRSGYTSLGLRPRHPVIPRRPAPRVRRGHPRLPPSHA